MNLTKKNLKRVINTLILYYSRFQLRVALYIAASLGHLDLAGWLLERGVRVIEPVGVHPYREWCHQTAHPDVAKCPAVASIERGQLTILKLPVGIPRVVTP